MILELFNLKRSEGDWESITLNPIGDQRIQPAVAEILETDQIKFRLSCQGEYQSAKLIIESIEIAGRLVNSDSPITSFEWMPSHNRKFGYDALFLHFFGVANLAIELSNSDNDSVIELFEPINIHGRRITAERAESMLKYISNTADKYILETLSPTSFGSKLTKDGIAPADLLDRLEKSLSEVDLAIRKVISRPITSLRSNPRVIYNPKAELIDDLSTEWIGEHAGLGQDATCENDGLFKFGFHWKGMPDVRVNSPYQSMDIYENQLIAFYLKKLVAESRRIYNQCKTHPKKRISYSSGAIRDGYVSFYDVSNKSIKSATAKYAHRAKICVENAEKILRAFNKHVPTTKSPHRLVVTEKIKNNRHYALLIKHIKEWLNVRHINWIEKHVLSSVNSTPLLFEYYTVLLTDSWLKNNGSSNSNGLFDGSIRGRRAKLLYEPTYPSPRYKSISEHGIWSCDINVIKGRRPDIVIDIDYDTPEERELVILDAKCRKENIVLRDELPTCSIKYGYGIRDANGKSPVKSVIMLHPQPKFKNDEFLDFYSSPHGLSLDQISKPEVIASLATINPRR
ncbi:DUF2357 domain-containing protein [Dongshaea marina]|uniref:DUF2357 domain-containing protein n=1 Tax=Dongshaea marina TaxID=2047966 RepID=UPI000D3E5AE8|nr:DUF2357 domain-containing protein [Dongshaea marina]